MSNVFIMEMEILTTGDRDMSSPTEELEAAALALPREERAKLARCLLDSLDEDNDVDRAWKQEVERRLEAYRDGNADSAPADEVLEQARNCTAQ